MSTPFHDIRGMEMSWALLRPAEPLSLEWDPLGQGMKLRQSQGGFGLVEAKVSKLMRKNVGISG